MYVVTVVRCSYTVLAIVYQWQTKDHKGQMNLLQNSQYSWNILFSRRSIWVLLKFVHRWTQTYQNWPGEHKIEQICIWNPMTTGLACVQPPPPLRKKLGRSLSPRFFLRGGGRLYTGYYRIYYINLRYQYGISVAETQTFLLCKSLINNANCIAKKSLLIKQTENLISLSYFTRNADSMIEDFFPSFLFEMTAI